MSFPHSGPGPSKPKRKRLRGRLKKWLDEWLTPCDNCCGVNMGVCSIAGDLCGATLVLLVIGLWTSAAAACSPSLVARTLREQAQVADSPVDVLALTLIRVYQQRVSVRLPARCSFPQTCSHYGLQVVREHGLATGLRLLEVRMAQCGRAGA